MHLYVSDLDGTLLSPTGALTPRASTALARLLDDGVAFTVATARSLTSLRHLLGPLPFRLPVIAHNGAVIGDFATGRAHHLTSLPPDVAAAAFDLARAAGVPPLLTTFVGDLEHVYAQPAVNAGQQAYLDGRRTLRDERLREVDDVAAGLAEQVLAVTIIGDRATLEPLYDRLAALPGTACHLFDDLYCLGWCWITVQPDGTSKATAIRAVQRLAALEGARVVVFGDQVNDLPMFGIADHAVAVANATPALRAIAHETIGPNAEDAVVRWLVANAR